MSKQDEADLILKLYDLRREEVMRKARSWYFLEFDPHSLADFNSTMFGEHSGHLRMVLTYWDMAAGLVNHGAISIDLFNDTNGEHISVFSKIELLLPEIRSALNPNFLKNLEKLIDATPHARERCAMMRDRMKDIRSQVAANQTRTAVQT